MKSRSLFMFRLLCGALLTVGTSLSADDAVIAEKNVEAGHANGGQQNLPAMPNSGEVEKSKKSIKSAKSMHSPLKSLVYAHPGAFHTSVSFTANGDEIITEDGAAWEVNKEDTYKVMHWSSTDQVLITPNDDFWSKYDASWKPKYIFRMVNPKLQISVAVRLKTFLAIPYQTFYNHRLATYNDYERTLWLEDGSVWEVDSWDFDIAKKWAIGHTMIIGVNDGFLKTWSPNLLINADRNEFVRCKCKN